VVTEGKELPASHLGTFAQSGGHEAPDEEMPTICGDVLSAARAQTRDLAGNAPAPSRDGLLRVEAMLGVITYCYVKGVFDSGEIERRLWQDAAFLATFGDGLPTAQGIRRFRRQHHAAILATIENAMRRFEKRTAANAPPGISDSAHVRAEHLLDMASLMDQLGSN
jgi:hypothetical protein